MDLQGSKTTKQGLLGSPLAAHGISLGVFHEFSDSLSTQFDASDSNKGRVPQIGFRPLTIGREVLPPADQRPRLLRPPGVLFLDLLEELHEFGIALSGGIINVLDAHLRALGGVGENAL
jgi:hypothetical protein